MNRRTIAVDSGIAALVFALEFGVLSAGGLGVPAPDAATLDALGVVLVAASSLPLVLRRRVPLAVYLTTAVATVIMVGEHYPLDFPFGLTVAVYTLAMICGADAQRWRRISARIVAALFAPIATIIFVVSGPWGSGMAPGIAFWILSLAGAWFAGEHTRLRREHIVELEQRARRAEYEAERDRRLAAAQERVRIARELHDSAGHAINVILVQAGAARLLYERDPAGSRKAITTIEDVARSTIGEIDELVRALRDDATGRSAPADPAALDELLDQHRASGLRIETDVRGDRDGVPRSVSWAAYRILQEALTNAARHGCGSADVRVCFGLEAVDIRVTNPTNAVAVPPGGGHGVIGMRERATLLGGTLHTAVERGVFRLEARLPHGKIAS